MASSHPSVTELPFTLEGPLEHAIAADPQWRAGLCWGKPRPGHPEGQVCWHIRELLGTIERDFGAAADRPRLRLIALLHDTFKYQAAGLAQGQPRPTHGLLAQRFARHYITDPGVLTVIELHDEAYKIWRAQQRGGDTAAATRAAQALVARLGKHLKLFLCFYYCDSQSGDKSSVHYAWFEQIVGPPQGATPKV